MDSGALCVMTLSRLPKPRSSVNSLASQRDISTLEQLGLLELGEWMWCVCVVQWSLSKEDPQVLIELTSWNKERPIFNGEGHLGHFNLIFCFSGWPFLTIGSVGRSAWK